MPTRMIRGSLLDSERYWSVTGDARQMFVHLMLLADDFGCVSLAPMFIGRRCFDDRPSDAKIIKLIEQLADADLIRVYAMDDGVRFGFIPRFGQRLRTMHPKHPMPPDALFADDEDARQKFNENRHKFKNASGRRRTGDRHVPDTRRPEVEVEGNRTEGKLNRATSASPQLLHHAGKTDSAGSDALNIKSAAQWASELNIGRNPGESEGEFQVRIIKVVAEHKATGSRHLIEREQT
jgi:hypothetical protein